MSRAAERSLEPLRSAGAVPHMQQLFYLNGATDDCIWQMRMWTANCCRLFHNRALCCTRSPTTLRLLSFWFRSDCPGHHEQVDVLWLSTGPCLRSVHPSFGFTAAHQPAIHTHTHTHTHTCQPAVPGRLSSHMPLVRLVRPAPLCTVLHPQGRSRAGSSRASANPPWPFVCSAPAVLLALHCADAHLLASERLRNSAIRMNNFTGFLPKIRPVYRCVSKARSSPHFYIMGYSPHAQSQEI